MKRPIAGVMISLLLLTGCSPVTSEVAVPATPATGDSIQYVFSQDAPPDGPLVKEINTAQKTLDVAIYSITRKDITEAIVDVEKRGVKVRLITDRQESENKSQSRILKTIKKAGIPIKENTHKGLMHLKVSIVDGKTVTTGSFNYTTAATVYNDEVLVIIHNLQIAGAWEGEFERMWNDNSRFENL